MRALHRPRSHYAWVVLATVFIAMLCAASVRAVSGIIILPLEQEFGWSRADITLATSINLLLFGLAGPFLGKATDRFGPRLVGISGLFLLTISVAATVWIRHLWQFYLFWGVSAGLGASGLSMVFASSLVRSWFVKFRGLALGILGAAMSSGQLLFTQPMMLLTLQEGWRSALMLAAALNGLLALPLTLCFLLDHPSARNLLAFGAPKEMAIDLKPRAEGMRAAVGSRVFWVLAISFGICGMTTGGLIQTHMIPHGLEHGFTATALSTSLAVMGGADIVGTVFAGWICDYFGAAKPLILYYLLRGLSLMLLPFIHTQPELMLFSVVYGLNWLSTVPATSQLILEYFGKTNASEVLGWVFFSHQLGAALAAYGVSILRQFYGDYSAAFFYSGGLAIIGAGLVFSIDGREAAQSGI